MNLSKFNLFTISLGLWLASSLFPFISISQESKSPSKYVVVAVYIKLSDVDKYMKSLSSEGIEAQYVRFGYPDRRELYYVHVYESNEFAGALSESRKWRNKTGFEKTWVFIPTKDAYLLLAEDQSPRKVQEPPTVKQPVAAATIIEPSEEYQGFESGEGFESGASMVLMTEADISAEEDLPSEFEEGLTTAAVEDFDTEVVDREKEKYYKIFCNTYYMRNHKAVPATIKIVDGQKSSLLAMKHSHELITFHKRKDPGYPLQFIVEAFGYKKDEVDINLLDPVNETNQGYVFIREDTLFVNFELYRHNAGDTLMMYNVFFFKDSNIMKSKSKYELNALLEMMQENQNYKIAIHGHTNGGGFGKIIKRKKGDKNLFQVTENSVRTMGGAKELSRLRAESVKLYLVDKGIVEDRMLVQGWGGKRMLYDRNSLQAVKNIRVEVVIFSD